MKKRAVYSRVLAAGTTSLALAVVCAGSARADLAPGGAVITSPADGQTLQRTARLKAT